MVEASSTGGGIRWEGAVPPGSSFVLSSHSGTIEFITGQSPGFSVNLSTVSGTIIAPLELVPTGENISRRAVTGTWGEPQARVALTAFSGDIILTIRP
jgi:hypothetical protein